MHATSLERLLIGPRHFLRSSAEELARVLPDAAEVLPRPQRIFLEDELATPLVGFPVLEGEATEAFRAALEGWVEAECRVQVAVLSGRPVDVKARDGAWAAYTALLGRVTENATRSSFGRRYPSILWLYHSSAVAFCFRRLPARVRQLDAAVGREHADRLKYSIFQRFLDRVLSLSYEVVHRVAEEAEEAETDLFPDILARMRDNVLILTEEHVGSELTELNAYFEGYVGVDAADFRRRYCALRDWLPERVEAGPELRGAAEDLLGHRAGAPAVDLLREPGWVRFVSRLPDYDPERLLAPAQVLLWESLLLKLKEFELLAALRRLVVPARREGERLVGRAAAFRGGFVSREVALSPSTRPIELATPWIVDPEVRRFGLVYDIAEFSSTVSTLRYAGQEEEDRSYRAIFMFQRRVNRMADFHRLKLEKYLGDGALYSGRHARRILAAAIHLQRAYRQARNDRFPFDRGMRIALNFATYRLLPVEEGLAEENRRYEFFGRGIVELSRLVTGKSIHAVEEMKTLLLTHGYERGDVDTFFAPMVERRAGVVDEAEQDRDFYAYISRSGRLVNEGIVATRPFVEELAGAEEALPVARVVDGVRQWIGFQIEEGSGSLAIGLRPLGRAQLKGLGALEVYEVMDGGAWKAGQATPLQSVGLLEALATLDAPGALRARTARPG
jgi:hypothetical protein